MRQVIKGKMYNTETATCVASYSSGHNLQDFYCYEEDLYKKKKGEFFSYGQGNVASKYSDWCDKGGRIVPLSKAEAQAWVEKYADADTYIELFDEPEE